jgi:hypothetical protein
MRVSRRRQAVGSTRWFGSIMFSHETTKITKLILFSDREDFLRDFASLCEKDSGLLFLSFPNDAGEPPPSGGRLDPLVRIDHVFTRSHKDHKVNSVFRSGRFPS